MPDINLYRHLYADDEEAQGAMESAWKEFGDGNELVGKICSNSWKRDRVQSLGDLVEFVRLMIKKGYDTQACD